MDFGIVILFVVGLAALWLLISLVALAFVGAAALFALAAEQGFIGLAVYFALWIFLFPFMLAVSMLVGVVIWWRDDTK